LKAIDLRNYFFLTVVVAYLLLNYGVQVIKIGAPLAEWAIILAFLLSDKKRILLGINKVIWWPPFIVWWFIGGIHLLFEVPSEGFWAIRDANHLIESTFIFIGFMMTRDHIAYMEKKLFFFFGLVVLYAGVYPLRILLSHFSPSVTGEFGQNIPILFNYIDTPTLLMTAAALLLLNAKNRMPYLILAAVIVAYAVMVFQSRTIFLQLIAMALLIVYFRPPLFFRWLGALGIGMLVVAILPFAGIEIHGRLGQVASMDFIVRQFWAIFGVESLGLENAVEGVGHRLGWWVDLYHQWSESPFYVLFGMGYGIPLIDYILAGGIVVRDPHNSVITEIARLGIFGGGAMLMVQWFLVKTGLKTYKYSIKHQVGSKNLIPAILLYSVFVLVFAQTEDAFQKPFFTVSYYFLFGVLLKIRLFQQQDWQKNKQESMS